MKTEFPSRLEGLPIFPLEGAVLLPGGDLPLNIFEPRYLAMIRAALAGDRFIGMIQPRSRNTAGTGCVPFYMTGCIGRISDVEETADGRLLINLHGVTRFSLLTQKICDDGYRKANVCFKAFTADFDEPQPLPDMLKRANLLDKMGDYMSREGLRVDWKSVETVPDHRLYTLLAMICPFTPAEKQALLEAPTFEERCRMMKCLMDIACAEADGSPSQERPC